MNAGGSCPPSPPGTAAVKLKAAEAASSPAAAVAALRRPIQRALNRARPNDVGSASGNAPPRGTGPGPGSPRAATPCAAELRTKRRGGTSSDAHVDPRAGARGRPGASRQEALAEAV